MKHGAQAAPLGYPVVADALERDIAELLTRLWDRRVAEPRC
jgi:hypothetical protein